MIARLEEAEKYCKKRRKEKTRVGGGMGFLAYDGKCDTRI